MPVVDIVIPVHNEAHVLEASVSRLYLYLSERFPLSWRITIVDNASTDETWATAGALAARVPGVRAIHLDRKGRGLALRSAWLASDARIVAYMDVDLSTDLGALLPLVAPLVSGHSDVAIGSRLAPSSRVARGAPKRELISRSYNLILKTVFGTHVRDAQCGFKADALRRRRAGSCPTWWTTPGSSTPSCCCWPSATACASTRCRSTGWTTPTAASTSAARRWTTCAASGGSPARSGPGGATSTSVAPPGPPSPTTWAASSCPSASSARSAPRCRSCSSPSSAPRSAWPAPPSSRWARPRSATCGPTAGGRSVAATPPGRLRYYARSGLVLAVGMAISVGLLTVVAAAGGDLVAELATLFLTWSLTMLARFRLLRSWAFPARARS